MILRLIFLMLISAGYADWEKVYLASFPRSGNHWVRYLIEEATNIATSSTYKDRTPRHMSEIFPWGAYCPDHGYEGNRRYPEEGEIVVIKTHYPFIGRRQAKLGIITFPLPHDRVIRLVRNPIDSFYSLYTYSDVKSGNIPSEIIKKYISRLEEFEDYWDRQENVFTFRYEDLLANPCEVLAEILEKIGYQVSKEDVLRAVAKYPPKGEMLKHSQRYAEDDLVYLSSKLDSYFRKYFYK